MSFVDWLWIAYLDLSTCRPIGMDVGTIPWTAADRYARSMDYDREETELLWYCVQHLEKLYFEHRDNELKRRRKHGDNKRKARSRNRN